MVQFRLASDEALSRRQADREAQRVTTLYATAEEHYSKAIELLEDLVAPAPRDSPHRRKLADVYSALAWVLATEADTKLRDPTHAVELAGMAVRHAPESPRAWRTLGVALYRDGQWSGSVEALDKSLSLQDEPTGAEFVFLAMAHWQLAHEESARGWYQQFAGRQSRQEVDNEELRRFDHEVRGLLGISDAR